MRTLLTEIKLIVNSRPLTYICADIESPTPLRPIDFLQPNRNETQIINFNIEDKNDENYLEKEKPYEKLVKNWEMLQTKVELFWQRWSTEYLQSLKERNDNHKQKIFTNYTPNLGYIVLLGDKNLPKQIGRAHV